MKKAILIITLAVFAFTSFGQVTAPQDSTIKTSPFQDYRESGFVLSAVEPMTSGDFMLKASDDIILASAFACAAVLTNLIVVNAKEVGTAKGASYAGAGMSVLSAVFMFKASSNFIKAGKKSNAREL